VSTASDNERLEMNGNGCAGSNDNGVSVGRTDSSKYVRNAARSSSASAPYDSIRTPASASAGCTSSS